ncbi:MAG: CRISPR-associated endonuclease Cas2 [Solobacterium sp.]|nr:CRISPR-associated endonuclease Cas2 [Solobacterium sp.]
MMIISYDIQNDKTRTRFNKYIKKYGYRLQFSVYKIKNSDRVLDVIKADIASKFMPLFTEDDSIMIFDIDDKNIIRYGYAKHETDDIVVIE